jgi:hypothetical protein
MNPSIFRPKQLVENSVEKIRRIGPPANLLAPAKNAAVAEMLPINGSFSINYEQDLMRFGLKRSSPARGLKAPQMARVLHKD